MEPCLEASQGPFVPISRCLCPLRVATLRDSLPFSIDIDGHELSIQRIRADFGGGDATKQFSVKKRGFQ